MRNYSTQVDLTNSFAISLDVSLSDTYFCECQAAIITTMDANPRSLSPSEEGVLADFIGWFEQAQGDDRHGLYPQKPVFFYANLNTGRNCVFVVTDCKGKQSLSLA